MYREAHPTITLNTANGCAAYTVMAAFYSQVYDQEDTGVFRYYQYADLSNEADFAAYVEQVQKAAPMTIASNSTTPPAPSNASSDCAACRTVWESRALILAAI